ncbi:hypothetical protein RR48_04742 [Papilio machaon]|uniref:Uncharacterized protein n=1 Tax=Papilio machaon TaxID=76193 RepID=A0A0N0PE58_PAPMA|nr:hypothetical protein RR48_04742 [Papilio machaon]
MSHLTPGPVKPLKPLPLGLWASPQTRLYMAFIGVMLYAYILFFIRTIFYKSQRLDQVGAMVMKTEQMIHRIHTTDFNMAINMERLDNGFLDY